MNEVIYVFIIEMIPWPSRLKFIPSVKNYKQDILFLLSWYDEHLKYWKLPNETFYELRPQICLSIYLFWSHGITCGMLFPQPGIKPTPLNCNNRVLTTGLPRRPHRSILKRQSIVYIIFGYQLSNFSLISLEYSE